MTNDRLPTEMGF